MAPASARGRGAISLAVVHLRIFMNVCWMNSIQLNSICLDVVVVVSSPLGTTMGIARVQFEASGPPISSVPSSPCRPYRSGHVIDRPLVDSHPASPSGWCVSDPMVGVAW